MTATITETDPLEALDFHEVVRCDHSDHNTIGWQHMHGGPGTHYVQIIHNCQNDPMAGYVYPCCQPFANYVLCMQDRPWKCATCSECRVGHDMCRIIATVNGGTHD
jgi:hypothetical protein